MASLIALTPVIIAGSVERSPHPAPPHAGPAALAMSSPVPAIGYVTGTAAAPPAPATPPAPSTSSAPTRAAARTLNPSGPAKEAATAEDSQPRTPAATSLPADALILSTLYTAANPFSLGNLLLDSRGAALVGSSCFGCSGGGITITDTRSDDGGWTASAQTSDFTQPGHEASIDGDELVFDHIVVTAPDLPAAGAAVHTQPIDHFKTARKSFATTRSFRGTVSLQGQFGLVAPTSTPAGAYTATITFTVV